jgi:hypothetical protein
VQPDELEARGREQVDGSLRLKIPLLHEPGAEGGAGDRSCKDGRDEERLLHRSREADTFLARKENRCSSVESLQA